MIIGFPFFAMVTAAESVLASWWQVVLVIIISYVSITLSWSAYRFRLMLENLKIPEKMDPEDALDFFQALIAQRVSAIKSSPAFSVGIFQANELEPGKLYDFLKMRLRAEVDGLIQVKDWVGVIIDGEPEAMALAYARWQEELGVTLLAGAAAFPEHSKASMELIRAAEEAKRNSTGGPDGLAWAKIELDDEDEPDADLADEPDEESEEDEIAHDPGLDPLTGVLAMHKVASYMRKFIGEYRRKHEMAFYFIGINSIADIEELHGAEAGDAVRKEVARLIQNSLREEDVIGRYDQDEFLALIICDGQYAGEIGRRLRDRSQQLVVHHNNRRIKVTVNVGISLCPRHGQNLPRLFGAAKGAYDIAHRRQGSMSLLAGEDNQST
jgi:diguanylate cyclase (GGDEF)-like protein